MQAAVVLRWSPNTTAQLLNVLIRVMSQAVVVCFMLVIVGWWWWRAVDWYHYRSRRSSFCLSARINAHRLTDWLTDRVIVSSSSSSSSSFRKEERRVRLHFNVDRSLQLSFELKVVRIECASFNQSGIDHGRRRRLTAAWLSACLSVLIALLPPPPPLVLLIFVHSLRLFALFLFLLPLTGGNAAAAAAH